MSIINLFRKCIIDGCFIGSKIKPTEREASTFMTIEHNVEYHQNKIKKLHDIKDKITRYTILSIDDIIYIQKMDKLYLLEIIYTYNNLMQYKNEFQKCNHIKDEKGQKENALRDKPDVLYFVRQN